MNRKNLKQILYLSLAYYLSLPALAQEESYKLNFVSEEKRDNYLDITPEILYGKQAYGYDLRMAPRKFPAERPFYFSVDIPDGNYLVKVELGNIDAPTETIIRGESRRLFFEQITTRKGEFITKTFMINKRNIYFGDDSVRIKLRERSKLNWDDKLTFEFNGSAPAVRSLVVEKADDSVKTIYLCGNSTVVDQDNEPWASWGQMIPRFFCDKVVFANYAESGESSNTFISAKRLAKILYLIKPGDYLFVEFGHNDAKQKGEDKGPYKHFTKSLKFYIDEARRRGAIPVLLTPTQRRVFNEGKLVETHGEFPQAVRELAKQENVALIDLTEMTTSLYKSLGVEGSKKALVHYPAGTYPGQRKAFADNTHFNPYGAYQIAKCVVEGIIENKLELAQYLQDDYIKGYDPKLPDNPDSFHWVQSLFFEADTPDGN